MIRGLINRFLGRQNPAPPSEPVQVEQTPEPQDKVDTGLPVEPGFHYKTSKHSETGRDYHKLVTDSLEHLWASRQHASDMHDGLRLAEGKERREHWRSEEIQELVQADQEPEDFDRRKGHVIFPDKKFEYHGDLQNVKYPATGGTVKRDGNEYTLENAKGRLTLDAETRDVSYLPNKTSEVTSDDFKLNSEIVLSATFNVADDGTLELPSAESLEEADKIAKERQLAVDATQLIEYAKTVKNTVDYRVDQYDDDHDPRREHTVASHIDDYWFLKDNTLPHMQHQTYSVEMKPGSLRLYEDSYGKKPEAILLVEESGDITKLQQSYLGGAQSLHVNWNRAEGVAQVELRQ